MFGAMCENNIISNNSALCILHSALYYASANNLNLLILILLRLVRNFININHTSLSVFFFNIIIPRHVKIKTWKMTETLINIGKSPIYCSLKQKEKYAIIDIQGETNKESEVFMTKAKKQILYIMFSFLTNKCKTKRHV